MLYAEDVMNKDLTTLKIDADVGEAVELLVKHKLSYLPIVDDNNNLIGVVAEGDIIRAVLPSLEQFLSEELLGWDMMEAKGKRVSCIKISKVMISDPRTVTPRTPLREVAGLLVRRQFKAIPVVEKKKLLGMIDRTDICQAVIKGCVT